MNVVGLILAGGSGSRLGAVRKWQLRMGGETLIARVAAPLRSGADEILISARPDESDLSGFGAVVPDLDLPIGGPMAGLVAAMNHLSLSGAADTVILSVAVDTPFLPPNYASRLLAALAQGHQAVAAGWRGNSYPTNAAWRLSALLGLRDRMVDGSDISSPSVLLKLLNAPLVDWAAETDEDPFANINTLSDLIALTERALRHAK